MDLEAVIGHGILKYSINHFGMIVMRKGEIVEILKIENDSYIVKQPSGIDPEYTALIKKDGVEVIPEMGIQLN